MTLSVHYLRQAYDAETLCAFRDQLLSSIRITVHPDLPAQSDCHILVAGRPQRVHILASSNLWALIIPWAGLPEPTRELMLDFPHIAVHNLHHNALPVAEHAIALLLAAAKFIVPMDRALRDHNWTPRYQPSPSLLLQGRRALVLGYGAIGRHAATLCQGLGMEVVAVSRQGGESESAPLTGLVPFSSEALHRLLPDADVLLVCLPHTPETEGIIGSRELSLLPENALLINVARGPIVEEAALYNALRNGTLYAAGLDVWYHYPADRAARKHTPPASFPFHELDNVVMSPHRAGGSTSTEALRMTHLAELLNTAARGESMPNRVNLEEGY